MAPCTPSELLSQDLGTREVVARFDGGPGTSDGGGRPPRAVAAKFPCIEQFVRCFTGHRALNLGEHAPPEPLKQRIFGPGPGYEGLNGHDRLRDDPGPAVLVGQRDPQGRGRGRAQGRGKAAAGKSTRNRRGLTPVRANAASRDTTAVAHLDALQAPLAEAFLRRCLTPPARAVLDRDATDFPPPGHPWGRSFHGDYDAPGYLPLYIFRGGPPLLAWRRPSHIGTRTGALEHWIRILSRIRQGWPQARRVPRGASGFCREHLRRRCAATAAACLSGLAQNRRSPALWPPPLAQAAARFTQAQQPARTLADSRDQTRDRWGRGRRVVGQAGHLAQGPDPRFVVTAPMPEAFAAAALYGQEYGGRGGMGDRIKEQQLMVFAGRVRGATMRADQVGLCLATAAQVVLRALRQFGLAETELASARWCDAPRVRLRTIGAVVRGTVRAVGVALSEAYPYRAVFERVVERRARLPARPAPALIGGGWA